MRCCVSFCKNSSDAISPSQNVTFHEFPTDQLCRGAWLTALGVEESYVTDTTVVCSLHFRNADFYVAENGLRMLLKEAVPSAVQVCLICLKTDTKLYPMSKYHLEEAYTNVTGLTITDDINFAQLLCAECAHRLTNSNRFRDNCLKAHQLLLELVTEHELLTTQNVKTINREIFKLSPNLVTKTFEPDHCDFHVVKEEKPIKQEKCLYDSVKTKEVKIEIKEALVTIEPMDMKYEIESDEEFLNDDIDNDTEFLNNDMTYIEVEIENKVNNVSKSEFNSGGDWKIGYSDSKDTDLQIVSDIKVNKTVRKKRVPKPKVNRVKKVRKTSDKSDTKTKVGESSDVVPKSFTAAALTYEEQFAEMTERKESSNYNNSKYKCSLCYKGFLSQISYDRHVVRHTNIFGELECNVCKLRFRSRRWINAHMQKFHTMRYTCTLCAFVTKQRSAAKLHSRWHEGIKYECPHCLDEFGRYTSYMYHLRVKHPSDFVCALCGYSFVSKLGIQQHCNIIHRFDNVQNPEGPLCEPCDVRFVSEAAYNKHMEVSPKHAPEGVRMRNDQRREYKNSYRKNKTHNVAVVGGIEDVTCEQCGLKLKDFRSYHFHFKREHRDKKRTQYSYDKDPTRCLCALCGKVFKNPSLLRYHMAEHSGIKPFQCDVCSKRFAVKGKLAQHLKMHIRSDYECEVCGKHFGYKANRDRHMWIHKNQYFKCDVCDKCFGTPAALTSHIAHVHFNKPWPKRKHGSTAQAAVEDGERR